MISGDRNNCCTFYLIRHGEAEGNVAGLMQGHYDVPLTEKGKTQMGDLAIRLEDVVFDAVYSSDLFRTKQSAEILSKGSGLTVQTSHLIRERDYAVFDGKPSEEYELKMKEARKKLADLSGTMGKTVYDLMGVENNEKLIQRAVTFLKGIAVANLGKTILIVTHAGFMRVFIAHIDPKNFSELKAGSVGFGGCVKVLSDGTDFSVKETSDIMI